MRKWNIPLTYPPKIEPVKKGDCTQTIRVVGKAGKKSVGDLISLHGYENGRGTPWTWRTPYAPIAVAITIKILKTGIWCYTCASDYMWHPWGDAFTNELAKNDFIVPPIGEALRDVLISKNGNITKEGIEAQILRWRNGNE